MQEKLEAERAAKEAEKARRTQNIMVTRASGME